MSDLLILAPAADNPLPVDIVDLVENWRAVLWPTGRFSFHEAAVPTVRHSGGAGPTYVVVGSMPPAFIGRSFASFRRF